ncbi:MAG TPA: bifunctional phosphopantothenoylcysteine decarboxylase/phosphopantothenate--cysteine ligase CoaBC [Alphaproteobacteria bacterium]|nr:bifunctional phosphopantothenoylcysteine decarboxylase/phosphopantothenate--cysteine ligase CoaBC [Alphaproteobacteria bacterium]
MLKDKRILLIIGGGIAAYKTLELIRRLGDRGASVRAVLTRAAKEFVTPLSVASLTGEKAYEDLFSLKDESEMGHIRLSREADLVVVAPATADLMAKMAAGLADDLATATLLASDKPILIAPAMNLFMWRNPATQRSLRTLTNDGVLTVGPNEGPLADGETGPGRLAEPAEIIAAIEAYFAKAAAPRPLQGKRALVTAGPTHEPIDPVRFISNRSSGKQGYAIAGVLASLGAETSLVSGPTALEAPRGVERIEVETAQQMLAACEKLLPVDIAVLTAAVADWRVASPANAKIKKHALREGGGNGKTPSLALVENPDILATLSHHAKRPRLVIGFAAETEDLIKHAQEKLKKKGCDWIVANDVSQEGVMGGDENTIHIVTKLGVEDFPRMPKTKIAEKIAQKIAAQMVGANG